MNFVFDIKVSCLKLSLKQKKTFFFCGKKRAQTQHPTPYTCANFTLHCTVHTASHTAQWTLKWPVTDSECRKLPFIVFSLSFTVQPSCPVLLSQISLSASTDKSYLAPGQKCPRLALFRHISCSST